MDDEDAAGEASDAIKAKHDCVRTLDDSVALFLTIGGFLYFQSDSQSDSNLTGSDVEKCIAIKAIGGGKLEELSFGQWMSVSSDVEDTLSSMDRFRSTSLPNLKKADGFTWLGPMEEVGGNVFQYGGFVYHFSDGSPACILPVAKLSEVSKNEEDVWQVQDTDGAEMEEGQSFLSSTTKSFGMDEVEEFERRCCVGVNTETSSDSEGRRCCIIEDSVIFQIGEPVSLSTSINASSHKANE